MIEKKQGVIVNIASEAGLAAIAEQVAYNLSKAAVISLTTSTAVDFAPNRGGKYWYYPPFSATAVNEDGWLKAFNKQSAV